MQYPYPVPLMSQPSIIQGAAWVPFPELAIPGKSASEFILMGVWGTYIDSLPKFFASTPIIATKAEAIINQHTITVNNLLSKYSSPCDTVIDKLLFMGLDKEDYPFYHNFGVGGGISLRLVATIPIQ